MKIAMLAAGTHGDLRPLVSFGRDLIAAGHDVTLGTTEEFAPFVTSNGIQYARLSGNMHAIAEQHQAAFEKGRSLRSMIRTAREITCAMVAPWPDEALRICAGAGLVIGASGAFAVGASFAEKLGLPYVQIKLQPSSLYASLPSTHLPVPDQVWPSLAQKALHRLVDFLSWRAVRPAVDEVVRAQLGLRPYGWRTPDPHLAKRGVKVLFGFSQLVVPPPGAEHAGQPGFWFLDRDPDWQPPDDLVAFLEDGPRPVYIGFGSMPGKSVDRMQQLAVEAARANGARVLLAKGWSRGAAPYSDDSTHIVSDVPHDWLFPRVATVVHHGGAGTSAAALRAGIPAVTTPFLGDQHFWAWRLAKLGVAAPPIRQKTAKLADMRAALLTADAQSTRIAAGRLGAAVAAETASASAMRSLQAWGLLH